jgi:hypothetical protein
MPKTRVVKQSTAVKGIAMPDIGTGDQSIIIDAHRKLLAERSALIGNLAKLDSSPYKRAILVDALISGIVAHLTDVAGNQGRYREEISTFGSGSLQGYAQGIVDNFLVNAKGLA